MKISCKPLNIPLPKVDKKEVLTKYKLPEKLQYCVKCVMSNQRPRIVFDENGVCNACNYALKKKTQIDWKKREEELQILCDKHRKNNGEYDVICPGSGGKDSAYVAHQLKYKYGMHPLTVTWSPHKYTEIGWLNLQQFIHEGFDNILGTPNGIVHRKMTRLAFDILGEPFQPFVYGQVAFPLQMAVRFNVGLVMDGENAEAEYGGDVRQETKTGLDLEGMMKFFYSNLGVDQMKNYGFTDHDLYYYRPPSLEDMQRVNVKHQFCSYYKPWIAQENFYYAAEHTSFQPNPDGRSEGTYAKYSSLDDRIDGFHYYLMFMKFGIGRCTADACKEIRDGHLTREEGVHLVRKFDAEFPIKYYQEFLEYCDITEDYFNEVIDSWRSEHLWEKKNGKWILKYQVS